MADVARHLGYEPEYGQSPFAIRRGLQFENWLFMKQAEVLRTAMEKAGLLDYGSQGFLDLRLRMNGGKHIKSVDQALVESTAFLQRMSDDPQFVPPTIIAGLMLRIPKGVMLPEATLIIDVASVHTDSGEWTIRVGEIKVFPDRGGHTDAGEIATARAQAGVYQHALQLTVNSMNLSRPPVISTSGYLVFTWPGTNSPVIRASEDLTYQARRAEIGFDQLDVAAAKLVQQQTQNLADVDLNEWLAHSQTEYKETCWSFCDLAPRCQDLAIADDRPIVLGVDASKLLGTMSVTRALEILNGAAPESDIELDVQQQLTAADWDGAL